MILLDKCCFCVSLRSGGVTLGALSLLGNIIAIIVVGVALANPNGPGPQPHPNPNEEIPHWALILNLVLYIVSSICSGFLIYGSLKVSLLIGETPEVSAGFTRC